MSRSMHGLIRLAEKHRVTLAGGDTAESPTGVLADIVVVGACPKAKPFSAPVPTPAIASTSAGNRAAEPPPSFNLKAHVILSGTVSGAAKDLPRHGSIRNGKNMSPRVPCPCRALCDRAGF